jgi:hypothetical protein
MLMKDHANSMLRILLLVIVGFFGAIAVLQAIGASIALIVDLQKGASHTSKILGVLTTSTIIALACVWFWRKLYAHKSS